MVGRRVVEEESDDINNRGLKSEGGWDKKRKTDEHTHIDDREKLDAIIVIAISI